MRQAFMMRTRARQSTPNPVSAAARHPAALNFGDCCACAVASVAREPLF
jgi:uncharacterized protein with PIN domain